MKNNKLWYLYNSGFALKVDQNLLIFDYYKDDVPFGCKEGLDTGVIRPEELEHLNVYVFVSHAHHDHHNSIIYSWKNKVKNSKFTYILSDDVKAMKGNDVYYVKPNEEYLIQGLKIETLQSNDEGLAFYIQMDNLYIFHSGDLNFWRWESESAEWNQGIEKIYKTEINKLKGYPIDIAFIPIDPRLDKNYDLSLKYFTQNIMPQNCTIVPMHFGDDFSVFESLKNDGHMEENNILLISKRGECFYL